MAYPTVSAPYGLTAVGRVDGMPYAGAIRQIPVDSSVTNMFFGDTVELNTSGNVIVSANGSTTTPVGVCVGGSYTNSAGQPVQGQYIPSGATNRVAFVVDDPMALFKVAVVSAGTTIGTVARAAVGANIGLQLNSGSTTTGDSAFGALASTLNTTATLPLRVIDVVPATATGTDAFTEILVKINTHQYNATLGV